MQALYVRDLNEIPEIENFPSRIQNLVWLLPMSFYQTDIV